MGRDELAIQLIAAANNAERRRLLGQNRQLADVGLADEIRKACYNAWAVEPIMAQRADQVMRCLARINDHDHIRAVSLWVRGIADITRGKFESSVVALDKANEIFTCTGSNGEAAQTQVAKLIALAMIGRYDDAISTGRKTLNIFVREGDELAAGKIEMNLSNVVSRQARHREAEKYCMSARCRFRKVGERSWQTMAENGLANTYAELNEFQKADRYYRMALASARAEKMDVTEAEIQASLGNLALLRGRFAEALNFLESSRQKYDELGMPHQSAIADLEIADIYSELNLGAEAVEIYDRVTQTFRRLKLTAEEARARLNYGRSLATLGHASSADRELKSALKLFEKEQNPTGKTSVLLSRAWLAKDRRNLSLAESILALAETSARSSENPRHRVKLALVQGEVYFKSGEYVKALNKLSQTITLAEKYQQKNVIPYALNAAGKLWVKRGKPQNAASAFSRAIEAIEEIRAPLGAEDFSMAFFAANLEPFENLARLLLDRRKIAKAFSVIERGRSRSLLDAMANRSSGVPVSQKLEKQLEDLRGELNIYYKRLDSPMGAEVERLHSQIRIIESKVTNTTRQIKSLGLKKSGVADRSDTFSVKDLHRQLGNATTMIEFVEFDGKISAFVISGKKIRFVPDLTTSAEVGRSIGDLQFHFGALRYGKAIAGRFLDEMKARSVDCLKRLFDQLLRPISAFFSGERLTIVSVGLLHYVPFHALHDGRKYVIENFETSYAPSAAVWSSLQGRPTKKIKNSLLMGFADERIPLVENEIRQIKGILPDAKTFVGKEASFSTFMANAPKYDLIHLACHGQFRAESPMFSSLHLADGWITVCDICSQKLRASLVTLSACETGLNKVFAGDEILGLARGLLTAGADALIVSLWSVNDESAGRLMQDLYQNLQRGESVSASLRAAQTSFVERGEHPYFWSPFILIGK